MMKTEVEMYFTSTCPYCQMAEDLLQKVGAINVKKINIENNDEDRTQMRIRSGRSSVPQIFIGKTHVGGYDDLCEAHDSGTLMALLSGNG
mgnify:CR=1 FL=1|tara:strand:+ start:559 stop:828 length:270 start_codon:yes stop_codon:yes gene_type:complete